MWLKWDCWYLSMFWVYDLMCKRKSLTISQSTLYPFRPTGGCFLKKMKQYHFRIKFLISWSAKIANSCRFRTGPALGSRGNSTEKQPNTQEGKQFSDYRYFLLCFITICSKTAVVSESCLGMLFFCVAQKLKQLTSVTAISISHAHTYTPTLLLPADYTFLRLYVANLATCVCICKAHRLLTVH